MKTVGMQIRITLMITVANEDEITPELLDKLRARANRLTSSYAKMPGTEVFHDPEVGLSGMITTEIAYSDSG